MADGLVAMANREKQRELYQVQRKELDSVSAKECEESNSHHSEVEESCGINACSALGNSPSDLRGRQLSSKKTNLKLMEPHAGTKSSSDLNDGGFSIRADFDMSDAQIIDLCDDEDECIERFVKRESTESLDPTKAPPFKTESEARIKSEPGIHPLLEDSPWESGMQLVQFRATAEQVADEYLEQHGIQLSSTKARPSIVRDIDAYHQGREDSSKIKVC